MHHASAETIKRLLTDGDEIAFIDIREHGQYGAGHPFLAVNIPYSRLETLAPMLLPCRSVRCVLFDHGDGVAETAARRLAALGYADLTVMTGGAPSWAVAGYTLFKGVNLPSKTFGELVEHEMHTPSISASELKMAQTEGEDLILLDGRTPKEFSTMTLPGARSCPNAELGYRLEALGLGPKTRVVINCAGRTRSIIGAQTLRNLGVGWNVVALRNGTQGWELAGFDLTRGCDPISLPELSAVQLDDSRARARKLIDSIGLKVIEAGGLAQLRANSARTLYLLDVRSAGEYAKAHLPGFVHAPGGQLVQATDQWVAVRNAQIVLSDDTGLRAATTAMWLRGMGHNVAILGRDASQGEVHAAAPTIPATLPEVSHNEVPGRIAAGAVLLDLSPSMAYRVAHIAGAQWAIRPRFAHLDLGGATEILLAASEAETAISAAQDLTEIIGLPASMIPGGPDEWRAAGLEVTASPGCPDDAACIDYLFFVHDRHSGNLTAAQAYLDWETGLVAQLDPQERAVLRPKFSQPKQAI